MTTLLSGVFARLEAAVFRRLAEGSFELLSRLPDWLGPLFSEAGRRPGSVRLDGLFAFLDHFLEDAARHWSSGRAEPLRSDPWEEGDEAGRPYRLQATAMTVDGEAVLILESDSAPQREFRLVREKARANLLIQEFLDGEVRRRTADIRNREEEIALRLVAASEYRDQETGAHVRRIGSYCVALAAALGWGSEATDEIRLAAPMHDIGKIGIPDGILLKPGRLSEEEFAVMKQHTIIGARILGGTNIPLLEAARQIALCHHERWDGTGYPACLVGNAIPAAARLVAVADVYDALTHERVYKAAMPEEETLVIMREGRGSHFDPEVFDCFLTILATFRRIRDDYPQHPRPAPPRDDSATAD